MILFNSALITGCGGDIGLGICRILKMSGIAEKIIGCDIHDDHPGQLFFDACEIVERADHKEYFNSIRKIIHKHNIDLIIPMSEAEISQFLKNGYCKFFDSIPLLMANENSIRIGLDKVDTVSFLRENNLDFPWTEIVENNAPPEIPCILKMRSGQGSKNLIIVSDPRLIPYYIETRPNDLWQELLLPDNEEYTCGLYRTKTGDIRNIIIKRKMQGGFTKSGLVVQNSDISDYIKKIAISLDLKGSINVQLRLTKRGPIAFEINPRFSSTVVFRHLLGFQDLIWSLLELKNINLTPYKPNNKKFKIYRGIVEYLIEET
jgi:carbamoyl-phosphate synthase large subunit